VPSDREVIAKLGDVAAEAGLARVNLLAWRDLDDPEAGGSEVHAATIARYWAEAGIDVTMRTSFAAGHPQIVWRDGYRVIRKAGRYMVFPRSVVSELMGWHGRADGLVEIWNGMPFFAPVWSRTPHIAVIHHLHAEMWDMTLPPNLARLGRFIESRLAPPFYRRSSLVTVSESARTELIREMHLKPRRIRTVHDGIDARFSVGHVAKSPEPLVLAVGRLVPVKRFAALVDVLATVKREQPAMRAVIVGDGYEREAIEARIREHGAEDWLELPGRIDDAALVDLYRRAWVLTAASAREGWGMSITEAAACGTPAVVSRVVGHVDAVAEGRSGLLASSDDELAAKISLLLGDTALRERLASGAVEHASQFTWGAAALGILQALADARVAAGLAPGQSEPGQSEPGQSEPGQSEPGQSERD
jgi:glycosyltransferase involved in cell wall biosynthesis